MVSQPQARQPWVDAPSAMEEGSLGRHTIPSARRLAPYVVRSSGRVAHSRCYITDLIDQYQFSLEHCEEAIIRNDYDQPIIGDFYRLRKL